MIFIGLLDQDNFSLINLSTNVGICCIGGLLRMRVCVCPYDSLHGFAFNVYMKAGWELSAAHPLSAQVIWDKVMSGLLCRCRLGAACS